VTAYYHTQNLVTLQLTKQCLLQHDATTGMPAPCLYPRDSGNQVCRLATHNLPRGTRGPSSHLVPHTPHWWRSVTALTTLPPSGGQPGRKGQLGTRTLRPIQGLLHPGPLLPGNACVTRGRVRLRGSDPVQYIATDTPRPVQQIGTRCSKSNGVSNTNYTTPYLGKW
jgi:hypothetical protein